MNRRSVLGLAAGAIALPALRPAWGQNFDHPVRIIVPFAPGGTSDILARILAPDLTRAFGQNVVVENRTGAGGNIGADVVAKSPPDGHTLLLIDVSTLATAPSLYSRLPFDLKRDLAPVTMLIYAPYILAVHPSVPARNAQELVAYAKANPQRVNVGHAGIGVGNHLTGLLVTQHWGADLTQVPYRGGAAALTAVAAGEAQLIINGATATAPFCRQGTLRPIAVTGPARLTDFPDVPTFQELGWPAADSGTWQGVLAQGGTAAPMVGRLASEIRTAMAVPATAERITALGAVNRAEGPDSFRTWLDNEIEVWSRVVRANNLRLD
ncbi:Bug family tripartite tricarboxylate transporter substrate binding protein [Neoroseomonas soli]|uniref:Tripartite tricarboxylate transporter substrate binding protein n=1 Tax=Neoroseomonas soli TaxID=1081025 RepID=A0A9X9X331_9PROT|nr:tripartite tricarboxylate transporter substrate-binding protein [Neoroseomonas soli]MBR0673810.1 tripartite tricarboxylate transporter substrate binding protein [Neoroseomonas soli]